MARDDYHVIVYQILAYLYTQLKAGEPVDGKLLEANSKYIKVNERYWAYIIQNLMEQGYIKGVSIKKAWGSDIIIDNLDDAQITPQGIEYLCDNSFIEKAVEFLKDIKAIVPFV